MSRKQPSQRRDVPVSRIMGCLLGGAVGDALGAPVELMSFADILKRFGSEGIREYAPAYSRKGAITDDTQMTLFTAEGLLRAHVRLTMKGIWHAPSVVHHAYVRWLRTQGSKPKMELAQGDEWPDGWLVQQRELWSRRAPGTNTVAALEAAEALGAKATNDSKGCGTVMRVAPVGIVCAASDAQPWSSFEMGVEVSQLTHGHPTGYLAGGFFAQLIAHLVDGLPLREAITAGSVTLRGHGEQGQELNAAVQGAMALADEGPPTPQRIESLGAAWVAEEAVAIALYVALGARDFELALRLAVNHGGDSDSTGSLVGNILGAIWGEEVIPKRWLDELELRPVIERVGRDLANLKSGAFDCEAEWERYPGW